MSRFTSLLVLLGFVGGLVSCAQVPIRRASVPEARAAVKVDASESITSTGSSSAPADYRQVQDSNTASQTFLEARQYIRSGRAREGLPLLESYVQQNRNGQYTDEALFYLARQAASQNDWETAYREYSQIVEMSPPSRLRGQALFQKAVISSKRGHRKEALNLLSEVQIAEIPPHLTESFFRFWGETALQEGRALESTLAYLKAWSSVQGTPAGNELQKKITDQIEERLNEAELQGLLKEYPRSFPASQTEIRWASLKIADGDREAARTLLENTLAREPQGSPLYQQASTLLSRVQTLQSVQSGKIGLLLPLSGEQEFLGTSVEGGFREAWADAHSRDSQGWNVEIVMADSGSSVTSAVAAFERLVLEDRVMAVVGPLAGSQAEVVARRAQEWGVPLVALSPRAGLVEIGNSIFQVALTPRKQVRALVGYAYEKWKARGFGILFPRDHFGKEFAEEYFLAVKAWGARVTAAESYDPAQADFRWPIENMTGRAFPAYRKTEEEDLLRLAEEKVGRKLTRKEVNAHEVPPIVDFQVVFVPDSYRAVGQIAPAMLYADLTSVRMVGPSTWHNPRLLQRAGQYLEGGYFVDIFAPERNRPATKEFVNAFQMRYTRLPNPMAAVGYDIGLAFRKIYEAHGAPDSRDSLRRYLEHLGTIEGACGVYEWDSHREPLKELQFFTIRRGAFVYEGGVLLKSE